MKQFIRYLYEYDKGKRVRNVGFVKVEKQMDRCTIHIHGKGMDFGNERTMELYIFYMQGDQCVGISQGVIDEGSPVIHYILKFGVKDVGNAEDFDAVAGIILQNRKDRKYAAVWNDMPVDVEHMRLHREMPEISEKTAGETVEETVEGTVEDVPHETLIEHVEKLVAEQETEEIAETEEVEVEEYIPPSTRTYEKIQRQDISRLPRREWKLANNSFLLHGFYNYHHLLYIEEGDHSWIGVPGIYHEKERTAARAFGFPQFHRVTDADVELSDAEKNTYDDFGYWCRQVDRQ